MAHLPRVALPLLWPRALRTLALSGLVGVVPAPAISQTPGPPPAAAADVTADTSQTRAPRARGALELGARSDRDWDVTVGMGAVTAPEYEGGRQNASGVAPIFEARWKRITFDGGLGLEAASWDSGDLTLSVDYDDGRRESSGRRLSGSGSADLAGLGRIDGAAVVGVAVSQSLGVVGMSVAATRWLNGPGFTTVDVGIDAAFPVTERLVLSAAIGGAWVNGAYAQAYFGVTPAQSASARLPTYSLGSGMKSLSGGLSAIYTLTDRWSLLGVVGTSRLRADFASSPIVRERTGRTAMLAVTYRF